METLSKVYDTVLPLAYLTDVNGMPTSKGKLRVDAAIYFYNAGLANTITSGGKGHKNDLNRNFTQAQAIKNYAIKNGVPKEKIYLEEISLDTIGQAIFAEKEVFRPENFKKIIIISSDYHMRRTKKIFNYVLGQEYKIKYYGIRTKIFKGNSKEEGSIAKFLKMFKEIESGDHKAILKQLINNHPCYKSLKKKKTSF